MARKSQRGSGCGYKPVRRSQNAGGCGYKPVRRSQKAGQRGGHKHKDGQRGGRKQNSRKSRRSKRKSFVLLCDPSNASGDCSLRS